MPLRHRHRTPTPALSRDDSGGPAVGWTRIIADAFDRTTVDGWGTADVGGDWTLDIGSASDFSTGGGDGIADLSAPTSHAQQLADVSARDIDVTWSWKSDRLPVGEENTLNSVLAVRASGGSLGTAYLTQVRVTPTGSVSIQLQKVVAGVVTSLTSVFPAGLLLVPDTYMKARMQAVYTAGTTLSAKVWRNADPEPDAWTTTITDATAGLQDAGTVALRYISSTDAITRTGVINGDSLDTVATDLFLDTGLLLDTGLVLG